jgi:hypothetical protein
MEERWQPQLRETPEGPVVDFGGGIVIPVSGSFEWSDKTLPYDVAGSYEYIEGRFELVELCYRSRAGGEVITGASVRKVPVDRVLRDHFASRPPRGKRRRLYRSVEDRLAEVARIYNLAYACHQPPTQAVATAFGKTQGAAEQLVIKAREQSLLGPTEQGKAKT